MPTARHFLSSLTIADNISFGNKRRLKCEGSTFSSAFFTRPMRPTRQSCSYFEKIKRGGFLGNTFCGHKISRSILDVSIIKF